MRTLKTKQIETMKWLLRVYLMICINIIGVTAVVCLTKACLGYIL